MKIGIIGAMEEEIYELKKLIENGTKNVISQIEFWQGNYRNHQIVMAQCGIGKVNAAICSQILISCFHVEKIINVGVAGAIRKDLHVKDIVISTDLVQHDFDVTGYGYVLGEIPRLDRYCFVADEHLVNLAYETAQSLFNEIKVVKDRIVSGDIFISSKEAKEKLIQNFSPAATEMEGAAIGQACYLANIPFLIIRTMSDEADDDASSTYDEFALDAASHSMKLVEEILKRI